MVTYMVPITQLEYLDEQGRSPFAVWLNQLDDFALTKVTVALRRLSYGNTSNAKSVGKGVSELKIDYGPGYRVYFGWDGPVIVILLAGGSKKRQQQDIEIAQQRWADYKKRTA
jgi:putative addiction module killer protein